MSTELAVVFPRASLSGGVERVVAEFLRHEMSRRPMTFVGEVCDLDGVAYAPVAIPQVPRALRPWAFRRRAAAVLDVVEPATAVSFGANCPPGDVYWVGSVHRAWLERGGDVRVRGMRVPASIRKALLRHRVLLRLERDYFVSHRPRLILCTSQQEVEDLVYYYGVSRDIMKVLPNGYDPADFNQSRRTVDGPVARARIGASPADIVVLLVANEWHRKGLGTLLEAVAAVGDPRLRIDLVGRKSPVDYVPLAQRLGVRMQWHGPTSDPGFAMAGADMFVMPTTYEPFGMVIIEAMACGLPVVTSALAGASEAIQPGVNGTLLKDPRDVRELATAISELCEPSRRAEVGAAAASSVEGYRWSRIFDSAEALIWPESA